MRTLVKIISGTVLALLAYIAVAADLTASAGPLKMRGEMIDIGGRAPCT